MKGLRFGSLSALLLLAALLPAPSQAQFGSIIQRAHALRTKIDSAKVVVDTSKAVARSTKATVSDATNGSLAPDTSGASEGGGKAGGKGGSHASTSADKSTAGGPSSAVGTAANGKSPTGGRSTTTRGSGNTTRPAAKPTVPAAAASSPRTTSPPSAGTGAAAARVTPFTITEQVYEDAARGMSVENAYLKTSPGDRVGAVNAATPVSSLSQPDYKRVRARIELYNAYVKANALQSASGLFSAAELAVLNAHSAEIKQLMQP
jgi:hypothetical protein